MRKIRFFLYAAALIAIVWAIGLVPKVITCSLVSILVVILAYVMYRINKDES